MGKNAIIIFVIIELAFTNAENSLITGRNETFHTEMSSVAFNWTSDKAIDGQIGNDPDTCECCSGTMNSATSWWTIDLGKMFPLARVIVQGREAENKFLQLQGFRLSLKNSTDQKQQLYYNDGNVLTSDQNTTVELYNVLARHVTIERSGILTICEVKVYEGDCRLGSYGEECSKECHCYSTDDGNCNKSTGHCRTPFCKIGWTGSACDKRCAMDTFGENCKEECFCEGNTTCTSDYGICEGQCRKGYHGIHCNKVCEEGTFGTNCHDNCYCAHGNGTCTKDEGICPGPCAEGYKGVHCNEVLEAVEGKSRVLTIVLCSVGGCVFVVIIFTIGLYMFRRHHLSRTLTDCTTQSGETREPPSFPMEKSGVKIKEIEDTRQITDSDACTSEATNDEPSDDVKYTPVFEEEHLYQYYDEEIQNQHLDTDRGDPENSDDEEKVVYDMILYQPSSCLTNWKDKSEVKINDAVKDLSDEHKLLHEMTFEMITSEASYLKSINTFIDVFMKSELFRRMASGNDESKREFKNIFSNIASIQETSENLLKELESHWKKNILIRNVCQIVANHVKQHFECYVEYCGNEHRQIKQLEYLCQNQKDFKTALIELEKHEACQEWGITSFIKLPMKRISRICTLTQTIYLQSCKIYGDNDETRKHANCARKAAAKVVKICNTTAAIKQGEDDMNRVATEIKFRNKDEAAFEIKKEQRYLVRDADVTRIWTENDRTVKSEELRLYIFNDKAVFTKKSKRPPYTVVDHCQLIALKCESVDKQNLDKYKQFLPQKVPKRFKFLLHLVILEDSKSKKSELMLSCKNRRDRKAWMKIIAPMQDSTYTTYDFPIVKCIKTYTAETDDELSLQESDEVRVILKEEDKWLGERTEDFEEGWFPQSHVEEKRNEHIDLRFRLKRFIMMRQIKQKEKSSILN